MTTPTDPADDLEKGMRFVHVMGMQTRFDLSDQGVRLDALVEELVARGVVDLRTLEGRRDRLRQREAERNQDKAHVQIAPNADKYAITDLPQIDCAALHPICRGRCCKLTFPLSFQDLDERVIQWEYGRPYLIKHRESDDYCVHACSETRRCTVYEHRPGICRTYDCRDDKRIWLDFENKIPAPFPEDNPPADGPTPGI